ncbi:MAG: Redox-active disulfide protein 2 [Clostridiales bacterium 38_11]|nr:MAG: Redox-active disulfide protein 2 [Clostridiales bacterium 38_11]HBH13580.1 redox-active disulfide protein 2 [Clostridiales bacterium]
MLIKVLGTGCSKCKKMENNIQQAISEMGLDVTVEKVEDVMEIMKYGVMGTPALVIDEEVKTVGKVLTVEQIKKYL